MQAEVNNNLSYSLFLMFLVKINGADSVVKILRRERGNGGCSDLGSLYCRD